MEGCSWTSVKWAGAEDLKPDLVTFPSVCSCSVDTRAPTPQEGPREVMQAKDLAQGLAH